MPPHPDRPENVTTWLVIPYFDGDVGRKGGERPLPAGKGASWLCPAFRVDGVPGNTAFERGQPFQLELEVANWGAGTLPAVALVRLWWSDPTMSFAKATPIGQTSVVVPPDVKPRRTGVFTVTVPVGASPHVCLLAQVSAPIDGAGAVPDPVDDRHWAQLNLVEVAAATAQTGTFPVLMGNPFDEPMRARVATAPLTSGTAERLAAARGRDVRADRDVEVRLVGEDGGEGSLTELGPHEVRAVQVTLAPEGGHAAGEPPYGFELVQTLFTDRDERPRHTGTLGVLVVPQA